jgi:methylated-DNA-[protein]-cysteine S-methyltransferase
MDMHGLPDFTRQVLLALRDQVPHGATHDLRRTGGPGGQPRRGPGVGQIMARNPWPLLVPCHRVLGVGGALTGFSAEGGLDLKRLLLEIEGAALSVTNRD